MHQDQRIGLALAVLLIGAAGAFFFRNDPKPGDSPRLKSARALDARISEKAISPYLNESKEERIARAASKKAADQIEASRLPSLEGSEFSNLEDHSQDGANDSTQDPIPYPALSDNDFFEGNPEAPAPDDREPRNSDGVRIHIVQKGETLSSISTKELGSSGRFSEIFNANRDQLNDANDVRVGMSLRIPVRRNNRPQVGSAVRQPRSNASAPPLLPADSNPIDSGEVPMMTSDPEKRVSDRTANETAPKKKFEPAKRVPLGAQGMGVQSGAIDPPKTKKLSQLPPKDTDGKVAR